MEILVILKLIRLLSGLKLLFGMKNKWRSLFSLSALESIYFKDNQDKFELASCPDLGTDCTKTLSAINASFLASERYWRDKEYSRAIEELKSAYYATNEITEASCTGCAELFRSTILESLGHIHEDLEKMNKGIYRRKRFQNSYELATETLDEFRKEA